MSDDFLSQDSFSAWAPDLRYEIYITPLPGTHLTYSDIRDTEDSYDPASLAYGSLVGSQVPDTPWSRPHDPITGIYSSLG